MTGRETDTKINAAEEENPETDPLMYSTDFWQRYKNNSMEEVQPFQETVQEQSDM